MDVDSSEEDSGPRKRKQASPSRSPSPPPLRERSRRTSVKSKKISYRGMDAISSSSEISSEGSSSDNESDGKDDLDDGDAQRNGEPTNKTSGKSEKDSSGSKARTKKPEKDDEEFRPQRKMARERSRSPPPTIASLGKKRSNEVQPRGFKVVVSANTASATLPLPKTPSLKSSESAASSVTSSDANTPTMDSLDSGTSQPVDKIKKKRKLLTGKGLEELGEMLNNPDAPFSSTPSHQFGNKSKMASTPASRTPTSAPLAKKSNQAKMDALNAIKMQFSIPKPRTLTPGDRED